MKTLKYLILVLCCASTIANADQGRGGGSYQRLIQRAGIDLNIYLNSHIPEEKNFVPPSLYDTQLRALFLESAQLFAKEFERRVQSGQTSYQDQMGKVAQVDMDDVKRLKVLIKKLKSDKLKLIEVVEKLGSMSTGEEITAINVPDQSKVILSPKPFAVMNSLTDREMKAKILMAFAGHEVLSLLGIENVQNYSVSATFINEAIIQPGQIVCQTVEGKRIEIMNGKVKTTVRAINFNWPANLSTTADLEFDVEKPLYVWMSRYPYPSNLVVRMKPSNAQSAKAGLSGTAFGDKRFSIFYNTVVGSALESFEVSASEHFSCTAQ